MAWIESHQALGQHPKTLAFAAELGCSLPTAVGHLQYLWWWALDYAQDGVVTKDMEPLVIRACKWFGRDRMRFWSALVHSGFVDVIDDNSTARIHDWEDFAGKLMDQREMRRNSNRAAQQRRRERLRQQDVSADLTPMSADDGADRQQSTGPNLTGPDQPPVGPVTQSPRPRARARDSAAPPRALRPEIQQCPLCRKPFEGSYIEHTAVAHKVHAQPADLRRPKGRRRRGDTEPVPPEIYQELEQMASTRRLGDITPDVLAAHEQMLARAHAQNGK